MNAKIRILSLLVAAVMIFGCLPMTAFATGDEAEALLQSAEHFDKDCDYACDNCGNALALTFDDYVTDGEAGEERYSSNGYVSFTNIAATSGTSYSDARDYVLKSTARPEGHTKGTWLYLGANPADANDTVLVSNSVSASSMTDDAISDVNFTPIVQDEKGELVVLEFDYRIDGGAASKNTFKFVYNHEDDTVTRANGTYTSAADGVSYIRLVADEKGVYKFTYKTWVRIRLVCNDETQNIYTYLSTDGGNTYVQCSTIGDYKTNSPITSLGLTYIGYGVNSTQYYDNIVCVRTSQEYLDLPESEYACEEICSFADAIANASEGDAVSLLADVDASGYVSVKGGVTLDLNGHNLTADGIALYGDANVIDSAETKGSLVVPEGNFAAAATATGALPVWNGSAYVLADVTANNQLTDNGDGSFKVLFKPGFTGIDAATLFADGAADNGLHWAVEIDCIKEGAVVQTIRFDVANEGEAGSGAIGSVYGTENAISLTVGGATNFESYSIRMVIEADCGITYSEVMCVYPVVSAE